MPNTDIKSLSGFMNTDDSAEVMPSAHHKFAMNGRFRGNGNNTRFENVPGNVLIPNGELPTGNNECIGSFYDGLKQRIIWFNYNSTSKHGIYKYDLITKTVSALLICFTDSQTDILNFSLDYPIPSVNIIYTTDEDGDLLCWTDRNSRPKILNILSAENNLYGANWLEEYLDVAKSIPTIPIKCAYEDDNTVVVNNLRKLLFLPTYRYVYGDNLKSCWTAKGNMPIPFNYINPQVDADPTKNCRIGIVIQTGGADVKELEIAIAQSEGNSWSVPFSVIVLNKATLSIPDNDVYVWRFYNNEAYLPVDEKESILPFDFIPNKANTQELLNGNVIIYGGILEGYDPVTPSVAVSTAVQLPTAVNSSSIMSVTQAGESGFRTGNIRFVVLGNIRMNDIYSTQILVGATTFTITYTAVYGDTPATVLAGLSLSATGQGFTQVSISANELVISRTGQVLLKSNIAGVAQTVSGTYTLDATLNTITRTGGGTQYLSLFPKDTLFYLLTAGVTANTILFKVVSSANVATNLVLTVVDIPTDEVVVGNLTLIPPVNQSLPAYNASSKENLGLVYFDKKGKTDGVITSLDFNATSNFYWITANLNSVVYNIPYFSLSISHRPPDWADYYHIVRTNNLTKSKYLYWMTDRTYKDDKYAYVSVESIQSYKKLNPSSIIGYDFASGDRIKFYLLFNADSTPGTVYFNEHDYEIFGQVINPDINGVVRIGQFLKLVLPTTTGTFDFSNGITKAFCYYFVELYTPAKSATPELSTYMEFSQRYAIINPTLATRCHQGQLQNQTDDLVTPATFKLDTGDAYYRTREINVGDVLSYDLIPGLIEPNFILGQILTSQLLPNPDYIVAGSVAYQQLIGTGGFYNNAGWTINDVTSSYTFLVKGKINFTANTTTVGQIRYLARVATSANVVTDFVLGTQTGVTAGDLITFSPNVNVILTPNSKVFVYMTCSDANFRANLSSGNLNWSEVLKIFNVGCIDQNFSDFYESKVNSNGRPFVVNKDERQTFFQTLRRWGLALQPDTNINQINRFYPQNADEVDRSMGDIQRFVTMGRQLITVQNRAIGQNGIFAKILQSNSGQNLLSTTDEILTKDNIDYYLGKFGCGEQFCGVFRGKNQLYVHDPVRGYQVRFTLGANGIVPISEIYKGQFYIQPLFPPYNKPYLRSNGSKAKILGAYNYAEEEAISVLQSGTLAGNPAILPYTFSFNEKRNAYCSFFDFTDRDWITSGEENIYSWKGGRLYIHNNTSKYCNFDGVQFYPSITLVFNDKVAVRKTFESISYMSNEKWECPVNGDIKTYEVNEQTKLMQISSLLARDFEQRGNYFDAAFLADANSMANAQLALVEGDFLEGQVIEIKLTYRGDKSVFLYCPYILWQLNNRNF